MPQVYSASPANTATFTTSAVASQRAAAWTLAVHNHSGSYADVTLWGAFGESFVPAWEITTITACAGGETGSSRYASGTDYFPWKRATGANSACAATTGCPFEVWIENREYP